MITITKEEVKDLVQSYLKDYESEEKRSRVSLMFTELVVKEHYSTLEKDYEFTEQDIHLIHQVVEKEIEAWKVEFPIVKKINVNDYMKIDENGHEVGIREEFPGVKEVLKEDYKKVGDVFIPVTKELTKLGKVLEKVKLVFQRFKKTLKKLFGKSNNGLYLGNHSLILFHIVRHGLLWNKVIRPTPRLIFNYLIYWILVRIGLYNLFPWQFDGIMTIHMVQFGYKPLNTKSRKEFIQLKKGSVEKLIELELTEKHTTKEGKLFRELCNKYRCNIPENLL